MPHLHRRSLFLTAGLGLIAAAPARAQEGPHRLPDLAYGFDANEAAIDARTMELHHGGHHRTYVRQLNSALEGHDALARLPLEQLLTRIEQAPSDIRTKLRNNGGGHANHSMFWHIMGGDGEGPRGELRAAIDRDFGSMERFREQFEGTSSDVFGSGWAFVTVTREGNLAITRRPNQDTPLMQEERVLMGNDLWEHAYYLRYQNRREEYIKSWWQVLHWGRIGARYAAAKSGRLGV